MSGRVICTCFQHGQVPLMREDRSRMRMTRSWSDYLLCQLTADKQLSTLESLPAEILEPILEELHLNSISGVRALAGASRTCRALASPYFFKPLKCEFRELVRGERLGGSPMVTLRVAADFKTLKIYGEPQPGRDRELVNIAQVLRVENTYECVEYLPNHSPFSLKLSAPALDLLSQHLPSVSSLVIGLDEFKGYSTSWDTVYKRTNSPYYHAPLSHIDGLDIVCALARFQNLRHLTLHFMLQYDQVALMHPTSGCEAVRELFEAIQGRKRGRPLAQLDVVFYTYPMTIFGYVNPCADFDPPMVSTTMTVRPKDPLYHHHHHNSDNNNNKQQQPRYSTKCTNRHLGKVIERRKRAEKLYGELGWTHSLGRVQRNLLQGRYPNLPWCFVMESLLCLALLPSYLVFEDGRRVRFEPSLNPEWELKRPTVLSRRVWRWKGRLAGRELHCL